MGRRYDWKGLRAAYEAGTPLAVLAQRHGLVMATLKRRCRQEAWEIVPGTGKASARAVCAGDTENVGAAHETVCAEDAAGKTGLAGGVACSKRQIALAVCPSGLASGTAGTGNAAFACGLVRAKDAAENAGAAHEAVCAGDAAGKTGLASGTAGTGDAETGGEAEAVLLPPAEESAGAWGHESERNAPLPVRETGLAAGTEKGSVAAGEAVPAQVEKGDAGERGRRELFWRQREEWAQQRQLLSNALARGDLEGVKLAKLTAEVLKIRQEGERRAWELAEPYQDGENGESGAEQLSPAVSELLRRLGTLGTVSGGPGACALSSGAPSGEVPGETAGQEREASGEGGHDQG